MRPSTSCLSLGTSEIQKPKSATGGGIHDEVCDAVSGNHILLMLS